MARCRYLTRVKPRFVEIESWLRNGMSDKDVAKRLGIAYSTLRLYRDKYEEFEEIMNTSKSYANASVESALYRKAAGFTVKIREPVKLKELHYDERGKKVETERIEMVETEKYFPPEFSSIAFYLTNREPDKWAYNKNKDSLDNKKFDHTKEIDDKRYF
nr:hypothetical protein [uncultured Aminipila sp.]